MDLEHWSWSDAPFSSVQAPIGAGLCYTVGMILLSRIITPSRGIETKPLQVMPHLAS